MVDSPQDRDFTRSTSGLLKEAERLLVLLSDDRPSADFENLRMARDELATKMLRVQQVAAAEQRAAAELAAASDLLASTILHLRQSRSEW